MAAPIKIFYSYAHEDEQWRNELEKHLSNLQQQERITGWHDRKIAGGKAWEHEIVDNIQNAQIILLLISSDFMASDNCSKTEVPLAMERYEAGTARVLPIIIRPVDHKGAPFDKLQALPYDAKPVTTSPNIDEAFYTIAQGIRTVVEEFTKRTLPIPSASSPIGNLPRRNPYFTGREDILTVIHTMLIANSTTALTQPQAISGLGGIGKTQTAIEYAYRYRSDYHYTFWVKADTHETLTSDFTTIAGHLNLREKDAQDQTLIVRAVKCWLEANSNWLLIFDNADDLKMVYDYLPAGEKGHILLTTRAYSMGGIAKRVEIEKMDSEQGALFLLRRAGIIQQDAPPSGASKADYSKAKEVSEAMDGLPLALDQAGAFIEETVCSLADYLAIYQKQRAELLKQRGGIASSHPEPIATTWSLSFEKVEQANPAAAELLRFFAFLHPDAIPEEIITGGASQLVSTLLPVAEDPIQFNRAIGELLKYSFVRRDPKTKTLAVHRLVQAVLKDGMSENQQRQWAEHAVLAVNLAFPNPGDFTLWDLCERCLPHAQTCAFFINQWEITSEEAAQLLNDTGRYLDNRARYTEAEPIYQRAIAIGEKVFGTEHPTVATYLNNLALLYHTQSKYTEAEPLFLRAIAIGEKSWGAEHDIVADFLNNLVLLYRAQGKKAEAESLYQRAIAIGEKSWEAEHPDIGTWYGNLAALYENQGRYKANVAIRLNNLACSYTKQAKYAEAEPLYLRSLKIREKALGVNHPKVATVLENYALLLRATNRESEAVELVERAKAIRAKHAQENR